MDKLEKRVRRLAVRVPSPAHGRAADAVSRGRASRGLGSGQGGAEEGRGGVGGSEVGGVGYW